MTSEFLREFALMGLRLLLLASIYSLGFWLGRRSMRRKHERSAYYRRQVALSAVTRRVG
jgi:hypothetical protein